MRQHKAKWWRLPASCLAVLQKSCTPQAVNSCEIRVESEENRVLSWGPLVGIRSEGQPHKQPGGMLHIPVLPVQEQEFAL